MCVFVYVCEKKEIFHTKEVTSVLDTSKNVVVNLLSESKPSLPKRRNVSYWRSVVKNFTRHLCVIRDTGKVQMVSDFIILTIIGNTIITQYNEKSDTTTNVGVTLSLPPFWYHRTVPSFITLTWVDYQWQVVVVSQCPFFMFKINSYRKYFVIYNN